MFRINNALLAQLDRAFVYGTKGQGFESLATHQYDSFLESFFIITNITHAIDIFYYCKKY